MKKQLLAVSFQLADNGLSSDDCELQTIYFSLPTNS